MLERDQANVREKQSRSEIARLLEQKQVDAVENFKTIEETFQSSQRRLEMQLKAREEEIRTLHQRMAEIKTDAVRR